MDLVEAQELGFAPGVRHPWETARVDVVDRLIRRHAPLERGASVLDIGCGDTFVVERLAAIQREVCFYAVDTAFTPELIERFRTRLNNPRILMLPSLDAVPTLPRPASLLLLMDVIEHIADDHGFLSDLRRRDFVGTDTRCLITVPAYQSLFCSHDRFLGHYRRYSNGVLRQRLLSSGFEVMETGYFFASLLPIRVLQVLKERFIPTEAAKASTGLVGWNGSPTKAAIMHRALVMDAGVSMLLTRAGIKLAGLSNYAVCRVAGQRTRQ